MSDGRRQPVDWSELLRIPLQGITVRTKGGTELYGDVLAAPNTLGPPDSELHPDASLVVMERGAEEETHVALSDVEGLYRDVEGGE